MNRAMLLKTIATAFSLLALATPALALKCAPPDAAQYFAQAAWVGRAVVLEVGNIQKDVDGFGGQAVTVLVEIEHSYKGAPLPRQRVVFGHVPKVGNRYTLFAKIHTTSNSINTAIQKLNPNWAAPFYVVGGECYKGDFLMSPEITHEYLAPSYAFIASLDKPSEGGSLNLTVYAPSSLARTKQGLRELNLFLKPLTTPSTGFIALKQSSAGYFEKSKLPPGQYQLLAQLPNPRLGLRGYWFYDTGSKLAVQVFYRLEMKTDAKGLCELTPPIVLTIDARGELNKRYRLDTLPNESLDDININLIKKGTCL